MNFLELVQNLHTEVGAHGAQPVTALGNTGEAARLSNWIVRADQYVQLLWTNWKFLRRLYSVATTPTSATASKPASLKKWDFKTFKIIEPGETQKNPFTAVEYDKIKSTILDTSSDIPSRVIIMSDNSLQFEPIPDLAYTIEADYYDKPTLLAANAQISLIPEEYHQIIIGRAKILYGNFEVAAEQIADGKEIYDEQLARLENDQLPNLEHSRFTTGAMIEVIAE